MGIFKRRGDAEEHEERQLTAKTQREGLSVRVFFACLFCKKCIENDQKLFSETLLDTMPAKRWQASLEVTIVF